MKSSTYKVNKSFIIQNLENSLSIFDPNTSLLITLNESAALIFKKIQKGNDASTIAAYIQNYYDIPFEQALKDTNNTIKILSKNKILL